MPELMLAPHFQVYSHPPEHVVFISEREQHLLSGGLYQAIVQVLLSSSPLTEKEIRRILSDNYAAGEIHYGLSRLKKRGFIIDYVSGIPMTQQAYWSGVGVQPVALDGCTVHLINRTTQGDLTAQMTHLIDDAGLSPVAGDASSDVTLVLVDDYLDTSLSAMNRQMLEQGSCWMLAKPVGTVLYTGPVFVPDETACYACLAQRLRLNRALETSLQEIESGQADYSEHNHTGTTAAALSVSTGRIVLALSAYLAGVDKSLEQHLMTLDMRTHRAEAHVVTRRPQCAVCGSRAAYTDYSMTTAITAAVDTMADSDDRPAQFRRQSAADTFQQYAHHISPVTGIVPYIRRMPAPSHVHVYASGANRYHATRKWVDVHRHIRSQNAGKGSTAAQARTGALCEALERYSGIFFGEMPACTASYNDLAAEAIHPQQLLQFSDRQYAQRDAWNETCPAHLRVPIPFDEAAPVSWSVAVSLLDEQPYYVPTGFSFFGNPVNFCAADSNGNAAGRSLVDAILHGFLELVERDSVAIWWYNRIQRPAIDLDIFDNRYIERTREYLTAHERDLWVLDIRTDLDIPVCVAVSRQCTGSTDDIILGFGADLDMEQAVLKAITEMNQSLMAVMRDPQGRYQSRTSWEVRWWQTVTPETDPYLAPLENASSLKQPDKPLAPDVSTQDALNYCINMMQSHEMPLYAVNQTRPDVGLPVVKVIAPDLRHFWRRFAPGRLYNVPVRMGWRDAPVPEHELNKRLMFI